MESAGDLKPSGLFGMWQEHRGRGSLGPSVGGAGVSWGSGSPGGGLGVGAQGFQQGVMGAGLCFMKFPPTS